MEENPRIRGLYTVVKFIDNKDKNSSNIVITRTLGKFGFVNSDYEGPCPNHEEFWLVRIDKEIVANNTKNGCFILTPVRKIDATVVSYLMPGIDQYKEWRERGIRYIIPSNKEAFYILPLECRRPKQRKGYGRKQIVDMQNQQDSEKILLGSEDIVIVINFSLSKFSDRQSFALPHEDPATFDKLFSEVNHTSTTSTTSQQVTAQQVGLQTSNVESRAQDSTYEPNTETIKTPYDAGGN